MIAAKLVFHAPHVDWKGLSPLIAVLGGSVLALMIGLIRPRAVQRKVVPVVAIASLLAAIGLTIWIWKPGDTRPIISGALAVDTLALGISVLFYVAGIATSGRPRSSCCARSFALRPPFSPAPRRTAPFRRVPGRGTPDGIASGYTSLVITARGSVLYPARW